MSYRISISAKAERDRDEAYEWYIKNRSKEFASDWYAGISKAIRSLRNLPLRCGVARENHRFPFELRELPYGRSKLNRHRILYTIEDDVVYVLHIRHSARDELREEDLGR